ncbi:UNVERIFIED_CONTAM: hypothetical protein RMT77_005238 [Armadillidium vulgare]
MKFAYFILIAFSGFFSVSSATKVIELSDRFLELRGDSTWIIMFYAPWCGHCKKLEPIWNHVAQTLYNTEIRTGKVDCTRFTGLATHFKIKGFPTIMFIKGDSYEIYKGDRTKEEIIGFALRMAATPVPHLDSSHLEHAIKDHSLFFLYSGLREGELWDCYYSLALYYRHFHFFYSTDAKSFGKVSKLESNPGVCVHKDNSFMFYPVPDVETYGNITALNESLGRWINNERFPQFLKITHGNLSQLWKLDKYLAILVIEEDKIGTLRSDQTEDGYIDPYEFKNKLERLIKSKKNKYNSHFQFGWTGQPDLANSIAMERLPLPSLIVVDTDSMNHYLPNVPSCELDEHKMEHFFDSIINQSATVFGGDSYLLRIYRVYYNAKTSLEEMWMGNPVLTAVLFGLPLGFLSLICYSIWCSDILDADEENEESPTQRKSKESQGPHEKKE